MPEAKFLRGRMLFRKPYFSDMAFNLYLGINAISILARFISNSSEGGFNVDSAASIISGLLDAVIGTLAGAFVYWVVFLIYLIPRRKKDNREFNLAPGQSLIDASPKTSNQTKEKSKSRLIAGALIIMLVLTYILYPKQSEAQKYLEVQRGITKNIGDWNVVAQELAITIEGVNNRTIDLSQAAKVLNELPSKFGSVHEQLEKSCQSIPSFEIKGKGIKFAIAKSYEALQISCKYIPQQSAEALLLLYEMISPSGTQQKIDAHITEVNRISKLRREAAFQASLAIKPYLSETERETLNRIIEGTTR